MNPISVVLYWNIEAIMPKKVIYCIQLNQLLVTMRLIP